MPPPRVQKGLPPPVKSIPPGPDALGAPLEPVEDGELLSRFLAGNGQAREAAFAELVRRHSGMLLGFCRRRLGEVTLAEDATQAVFLLLARKAHRLRNTGSLAGWLYRTAELATRSIKRERLTRARHEETARRSVRLQEAAPPQPDSEADEALAVLRRRLDEALLQLKAGEREAVLLHYLEGLPQPQAAKRLRIAYPAYRKRLSRALERLRGCLDERGEALGLGTIDLALWSIGREGDTAAGAALRGRCTGVVLDESSASPAVQKILKGVLGMFRKKLLLVLGAAALLLLGLASALQAADARPPIAAPALAQSSPEERPRTGPAGELLAASHLLLDQIRGVGRPVFSPDGRWLAVRETGNKLAVLELAAALKDPKVQPLRYDLAPPFKSSSWGDAQIGLSAAFSSDGRRLIFPGKEGLRYLKLPAQGAPEPMRGAKGAPLGTEYVPALHAGQLNPIRSAGQEDRREETWPLLKVITPAPATHPPRAEADRAAEVQLVTYRFGVQGDEPRMEGPLVRHASLSWAPGGQEILATLADGSAATLEAFSARTTRKIEIQGLEKLAGRRFESVAVCCTTPDGKWVVEAARQYPPEMRERIGTFVPQGDEAPERGRNPGSAEPGPAMPRQLWLCDGPARTKIWMGSTARWLDTLMVLPSLKADRYLFFQVANEGGAGNGVPQVWLGQLDAAGRRTEKNLGNPFAKTVDAPRFELLNCASDASQALVLMQANRIRQLPKRLDAETRKKLEQDLKLKKTTAAHRDGHEAMLEMLAGALLFQKYERAGGSDDGTNVILTFSTWQVWELDAAKQALKAVTPEFGEAIGELENVVGLPGAPGGHWDGGRIAYSAQAGLLAMNLQGMRTGAGPGEFWVPRGLALIKVPGR